MGARVTSELAEVVFDPGPTAIVTSLLAEAVYGTAFNAVITAVEVLVIHGPEPDEGVVHGHRVGAGSLGRR